MIAKINGTVEEFLSGSVIVDVGGVGYEVLVTAREKDAIKPGDTATFYIAENIKEDHHTLYGFLDLSSRELYYKLTSVNGVGPKAAMSILSSHSTVEIASAIMSGNTKLFSGVSGIGLKTAQRIILDLKGKLVSDEEVSQQTSEEPAYQALLSLGFKPKDATTALKGVPADLSTQERVKMALKVAKS